MVGAAATLAYSLSTGFDRTAGRAHLPDVLATFDPVRIDQAAATLRGLPNVDAIALQLRHSGVHVVAGGNYNGHATVVGVVSGPHGYVVASGRDLGNDGEVVVEAGLARVWQLQVGQTIAVGEEDAARQLLIVGTAITPDNVAFPLAHGPRLYMSYGDAAAVTHTSRGTVDGVSLWLNDPRSLDVTLAQARAAAFGVTGLQFVTRTGLRLVIGQAAGIVVAVLVAFSVVALVVAATMLAASSAAEVQRRLEAVGLLQAIGVSRRDLTLAAAVESAAVAVPAAAVGLAVGWLVVRGPTDRLLASLSQLGAGWSIAPVLLAALAVLVAVVVAATIWPTWWAARRPPVELLRGADVAVGSHRLPLPAGAGGVGMRLVLARPLRSLAAALVVGSAVGVVLVMLTIASVLQGLNSQPLAVGTRYQLLVDAPASAAPRIARLPGVIGAAPRYEIGAADSFALGEPFVLIAFPGDHSRFEAPRLLTGRRLRTPSEAEVGVGLAQALALSPGALLAAQLPTGQEVRFRVVGIVQAFQDQGRVAYVQPDLLLRAGVPLSGAIAVRLRPGAPAAPVTQALSGRAVTAANSGGIAGQGVQSWAARSSGFLDLLVVLLRSVAAINAAVCVYAVAQALALIAQERRRALSIVRATGAGRWQMGWMFASGALVLVAAAMAIGIVAERGLIGPGVARMAASYITLSLGADLAACAYTAAGLLVGTLAVAVWTTRAVTRRPIVAGMREE